MVSLNVECCGHDDLQSPLSHDDIGGRGFVRLRLVTTVP